MARTHGRDNSRERLAPVRAPLEVASGPTPRSLQALAPTDEVLAAHTEKRLRERIAAFAPTAIYVPVAAPPVVGALVRLRLRDRTRVVGEVVWSRRELPLSGVAVRYVPAALPKPEEADGADAWEDLISSPGAPELPPAAAAVLRAAAKPGAGAAELAKAVSADPELAEAVVDLANSADYRAPEPIKDVRGAVVRLGLERVRSLVLASSVFRLFPADSGQAGAEPRVSPAGLWTHALAAAFSAEAVARLAGTPSEDAFLAGLFHDLGKLLLARQLPGPYAAVLDRVEESSVTLAEAESEMLGFTHARAGAWLLSKWGLPGSVVTAVSGHHPQPAGAPAPSRLTSWVHVGDLVARALAAGSTADRRLPVAHAPFWEALGIGPGEVALVVRSSGVAVAAGSGVFVEAGVRAPFLPQTGEATEADPILRGAAEAAAARRREELFASARGPAGLDAYAAALLAGAEALVTGGAR